MSEIYVLIVNDRHIDTEVAVFVSRADAIAAAEKENSFYDGIDVSLNGIASLASGDTGFLKEGLAEIAKCVGSAQTQFNPNHPAAVAPQLADWLKGVRTLLQKLQGSGLS